MTEEIVFWRGQWKGRPVATMTADELRLVAHELAEIYDVVSKQRDKVGRENNRRVLAKIQEINARLERLLPD